MRKMRRRCRNSPCRYLGVKNIDRANSQCKGPAVEAPLGYLSNRIVQHGWSREQEREGELGRVRKKTGAEHYGAL